MSTVKVSWSGGKDSTCALDLHLKRGDKVIAVCYVPMFTDTIPLIFPNHYEWITKTAERFRREGADIHIVTGMTYYDFFYKVVKKGQNKGTIYGFPNFIHCAFKCHSKIPALDSVKCEFDYEDIGIAVDEVERQAQLNDKKRSILVEEGYTEEDAFNYCRDNGLLSPHYGKLRRDGCAICPNAPKQERQEWFRLYPEAIPIMLKMQDDQREAAKKRVYTGKPFNGPLRGGNGSSKKLTHYSAKN